MRATLDALRADPTSKRARDELRRRVHALGAAAKLLRFKQLGDELKILEDRLEEAAQRGELEDADFGVAHDLIGRMTTLAWAQTEEPDSARPAIGTRDTRTRVGEVSPSSTPISVLVMGGGTLADALVLPSGRVSDDDGQAFEVERTSDLGVALDLAKALAPDVAVIDGDLPEARGVIEVLLGDALTDAIPVIVCTKLARTDDAGPLLALGVAKILPKPVSPGELRRACASAVATYVRREVTREPLGELNLDQLGARLAEELRRGLCDTLEARERGMMVKLGDGTEVLAALWGAVARIRDVVTIKTHGQVRFANGGPEGAVPLAPWLEATEVATGVSSRRSTGRSARAEQDIPLDKMRVVVADDDAAVSWFLAGVLKTAGVSVYEARDGERALEIAKHCQPDLVISDILMPRLDGFSLSRSLRRDVILRDVPIILLSWKEDLLQRVRELGADADGYLRKEASAGAIVQRVRELVRQRARVTQRIVARGEVRGRLDGLTTFTLLRLVCRHRQDATVTVRDASFLYEVEIRAGRPVRATRTSVSGAFERGPSVMAALLGAGDGRFAVAAPREDAEVGPVRAELDGTLEEQLMPVIASARAAQRLLTGANLMRVQRVEVDEDAVQGYWGATPESARVVLSGIAAGRCPRDLVTAGEASARLVEDVLVDVASHGAIVQVIDGAGEDRLPSATTQELALLRGERAAEPIASLPVLTTTAALPPPAAPAMDVAMPAPSDLMRLVLGSSQVAAPAPLILPAGPVIDAAGNSAPLSGTLPSEPTALLSAEALLAEVAPGSKPDSLDDPWFNDGTNLTSDDESPQPSSGPRPRTPAPASIAASPALESRSEIAPPAAQTQTQTAPPKPVAPLPVLTLSPMPEPVRSRAAEPAAARDVTPTPSSLPPPPGLKPMLTLGSLHPPPVLEPAKPTPTPKPKNVKKSPVPAPVAPRAEKEPKAHEATPTPKFVLPSAFLNHLAPPPKRDRRVFYWVAFAVAGLGFALWARWSRERSLASESALMASMGSSQVGASAPSGQVPEDALNPLPSADIPVTKSEPSLSRTDDQAPEELPLREGEKLKKGLGLLEIVAGKSDTVYVDGKPVGSGPVVSLPLKARKEAYEVKVKTRGEERSRSVTVKEGKLVRLRLAPPWQR
ncbi:MAG: response regulator [Polyangiaceae bacterium]